MAELLSQIQSPADLHKLSDAQLAAVAQEIRDELVKVLSIRSAHFASNLGVVELCLALHLTYDFAKDRLIWDTGHQIYPHKLITGRHKTFRSIRTKGGLMGFPNPAESPYDLFMTGHAGSSVSTISGLKAGDDLLGRTDRHAVAVIGDGAFPSGIVFEAFNNIAGLKQNALVVLNDNEMSICPRTGGMAHYLDHCRATGLYQGSKRTLNQILNQIPLVGEAARTSLESLRDGLKAVFKNGMLFEEMGFRYFGPVDGHDLAGLRKILKLLKTQTGPVLLHVLTTKGHGVPQAAEDPVTFHSPPVFEEVGPERRIVAMKKGGAKAYTDVVSAAIHAAMAADPKVAVLTAAMCQGNKLEKVRADYPTRFFDTGICESHAVAFAAGMAKAGAKPIVDIYSTFLQRSFDQIFQEVALQNLPVVFTLDRAGLAGPDGPTHHGVFDVPYMRLFPNMTMMAPGDELDVEPMLRFALAHNGPISIRYPKANLDRLDRTGDPAPIELGKAEVIDWGEDGCFVALGTMTATCVAAAKRLHADGIHMGVINARFVKPLDRETILRAVELLPLVVTVEEGTLEGGFGSAVLEAANAAGLDARNVLRKGIPDKFIEHGDRAELLADIGLDVDGLVAAVRKYREECADRDSLSGYAVG
ncbi:1-deoxy-D-xylulose-5-phosphate synthase [Fimbriiglobus ruber]|uniref:1-deoxy-D-xylulose-5-phosphate synthase n=1 Tax=Fimbriiglobus ruber TaxID=1908690 RepID=A0A225E4Y5_9BACT|nr:1-deoxy-D-xylulose-5-phosphate synthase [Fimbriiglobus ruber]OWK43745.1 1-deoxy-D-xylulose 5-phosphate synthase [Fimbriiglobus ruber]